MCLFQQRGNIVRKLWPLQILWSIVCMIFIYFFKLRGYNVPEQLHAGRLTESGICEYLYVNIPHIMERMKGSCVLFEMKYCKLCLEPKQITFELRNETEYQKNIVRLLDKHFRFRFVVRRIIYGSQKKTLVS